MNAVDTNVLLYSHDFRDPRKQAIAAALISSLNSGVLLWQVACEFVASSNRLKLKQAVTHDCLYTEDFSGYSAIDGMKIINPFAP